MVRSYIWDVFIIFPFLFFWIYIEPPFFINWEFASLLLCPPFPFVPCPLAPINYLLFVYYICVPSLVNWSGSVEFHPVLCFSSSLYFQPSVRLAQCTQGCGRPIFEGASVPVYLWLIAMNLRRCTLGAGPHSLFGVAPCTSCAGGPCFLCIWDTSSPLLWSHHMYNASLHDHTILCWHFCFYICGTEWSHRVPFTMFSCYHAEPLPWRHDAISHIGASSRCDTGHSSSWWRHSALSAYCAYLDASAPYLNRPAGNDCQLWQLTPRKHICIALALYYHQLNKLLTILIPSLCYFGIF